MFHCPELCVIVLGCLVSSTLYLDVADLTLPPTGSVQKMLRLDPSKRITARAALEHDYFRDLEHA